MSLGQAAAANAAARAESLVRRAGCSTLPLATSLPPAVSILRCVRCALWLRIGSSTSLTAYTGKPDAPLKVANAVKCRHILVDKLSVAQEAITRLNAGEAFNKVAMEMVSHCSSPIAS